MEQVWIETFEGLNALEPEWKNAIARKSRLVSIPKETKVFEPGKSVNDMIFLLEGTGRVQQVSEGGREIVLYRIEAGQSCIMTASCLLGHEEYSAEGISETKIVAAVIPQDAFNELLANSASFRSFVFSTFSQRLAELMTIINEVAFRRLDIRLAQKLLDLSSNTHEVKITHQQLATELGTVREVVSRQLQEFHRRNWLELNRGLIVIKERRGLIELATKHD